MTILFLAERAHSVASQGASSVQKIEQTKYTQPSFSPIPIQMKLHVNDPSILYPYKPSETVYAQGSHRSLVLVNGGIQTNTIQEVVEEHLFNNLPAGNN